MPIAGEQILSKKLKEKALKEIMKSFDNSFQPKTSYDENYVFGNDEQPYVIPSMAPPPTTPKNK